MCLFHLASLCVINIFNPVYLGLYNPYISSGVEGNYLLYQKQLFRMQLYLSHLRIAKAGPGKDIRA